MIEAGEPSCFAENDRRGITRRDGLQFFGHASNFGRQAEQDDRSCC